MLFYFRVCSLFKNFMIAVRIPNSRALTMREHTDKRKHGKATPSAKVLPNLSALRSRCVENSFTYLEFFNANIV